MRRSVARFMAILTTLCMHFGGVKSTVLHLYDKLRTDDERPGLPTDRLAGVHLIGEN
jgi:hypothetical protein